MARNNLLKEVKASLKNSNGVVTYYKGWVIIDNKSYNGIREKDINKLLEEISNE